MRIVHFSDWHGERHRLPAADLYVCTGDMMVNFPLLRCEMGSSDRFRRGGPDQFWRANMHLFREGGPVAPGQPVSRELDPKLEEELQGRWIREVLGSYRDLFPPECRDNPVVCVRGNHDFHDLASAFGGDVWEVTLDPTRTTKVCGLTVGGCRGIPFIVGEWSDELTEDGRFAEGSIVRPASGRFEEVAAKLPAGIELLITHAPPYGMHDVYGGEHYGSRALNNYINERLYVWGKLRMHCFGHIHEARGSVTQADIVFSNAARTHITYEL